MAEAVAKIGETVPVPMSELEKQMQADAGRGVSTSIADNIIPQITILQPLSPEVLDGPEQIEGAKPGDLLVGKNLHSGKNGIWFQPCGFHQLWLEFTPLAQGGGFISAHPYVTDSNGQEVLPDGAYRKEKMRVAFKNGNECIHYRQLAGIVWENGTGLEYIIPFKSTGHTIAKEWNTKALRLNRFANGQSRSLWSHIYNLTTSQRRNQAGQWYVIDVGQALLLSDDDQKVVSIVGNPAAAYAMAGALATAFERNEKTAATPVSRQTTDDEVPF